jgi:uncharacterized protein
VRLAIRTFYPWDGRVEIEFESAREAEFTLHLRIPGWCRALHLGVNGAEAAVDIVSGYARLRRRWRRGDRVVLNLPMPVERVRADPRVASAAGQVALQRGPVVYCVEEIDNGPNLAALSLPRDAPLAAQFAPELLGGCVVVEGFALREATGGELYSPDVREPAAVVFRAVPYALWANRGEGEMRVWLRES